MFVYNGTWLGDLQFAVVLHVHFSMHWSLTHVALCAQVGMREADAKSVVKQLASALEFMHSKQLVHRDIKPENVLVMSQDFSRVKLMDFGMTRRHGTMVRKTNGSIPYTPPEVCEAVRNENILVSNRAFLVPIKLFALQRRAFTFTQTDL
jgi:serine/threonine protein kinase